MFRNPSCAGTSRRGGTGYNFKASFTAKAGETYYIDAGYADRDWELYGSYPFIINFKVAELINISRKPSSVKAKAAAKGKVTLTWKKFKKTKKTKALWKRIKYVQVQYSTNKSFAVTDGAPRTTATLPKKATKFVVKKLKPNTYYYFRVRYWDGKNGYSAWSAVKKVRTKK